MQLRPDSTCGPSNLQTAIIFSNVFYMYTQPSKLHVSIVGKNLALCWMIFSALVWNLHFLIVSTMDGILITVAMIKLLELCAHQVIHLLFSGMSIAVNDIIIMVLECCVH